MEIELDTSNIQQTPVTHTTSWRAPRHVYFGKKGEDGMMQDEPVYVYQKFPSMLYKLNGEKLMAAIVQNEEELSKRTADGWKDSPEAFGILTAPSFDQINAQKSEMEREDQSATQIDVPAAPARRGRPLKEETL
jgi:hypothetical protein